MLYADFDFHSKLYFNKNVTSLFYTNSKTDLNQYKVAFRIRPEIHAKIWNFVFGTGFHGYFSQDNDQFPETLTYQDDFHQTSLLVHIAWNQPLFTKIRRLFFLPNRFLFGATINPANTYWKNFKYAINIGLHFKFNYYIKLLMQYRKLSNIYGSINNDFFTWKFTFHITERFSIDLDFSRILYGKDQYYISSIYLGTGFVIPLTR
jgi:hypothetical protein